MKGKAPDIRILTIRDQKVVLDSDLARVYRVTTKRLNEQLRRNRKRFPQDFAFQLSVEEYESLRSQFATLDEGTPRGETKRSQSATTSSSSAMWSQFATTSRKRRRKTHRPWAFTEHGALQAANILRSERAIAMNTTCGDAVGWTALVAW
jgi:ORF6N domain